MNGGVRTGAPNWNACDFYLSKDEPTCLECFFNTAWSPPEPVWEKLGEMFPTLTFELSGCEPGTTLHFAASSKMVN